MFIASGAVGQTCRLVSEPVQTPCKRYKQHDRGEAAAGERQARPLSPYMQRVGGGFDYIYPNIPFSDAMPRHSASTVRRRRPATEQQLMAMDGGSPATLLAHCHHEYDMRILAEIIEQAGAHAAHDGLGEVCRDPPRSHLLVRRGTALCECMHALIQQWPCAKSQAGLAHVLRAYDRVLTEHAMQAAEDTHYYRLLIMLSLRPEPGWWDRLAAQRAVVPQNTEALLSAGAAGTVQLSQQPPAHSSHQQGMAGGVHAGSGDGRTQQEPRHDSGGAADPLDWQEIAEGFLARTGPRGPLEHAVDDRWLPNPVPRLPGATTRLAETRHSRRSRSPPRMRASGQHDKIHMDSAMQPAVPGQPQHPEASPSDRQPLAEMALNMQDAGTAEQPKPLRQQTSRSGHGEEAAVRQLQQPRRSETGSVLVAGLIHGRSYKLVPVQEMPVQRNDRVASWLAEAAAATRGRVRHRIAATAAIERPRQRPMISREPEHRPAADRELHRRAAADREVHHRRRSALHAPSNAARGMGDARRGQWRSKSGSPVGGRKVRTHNRMRRRSASPHSSHRIQLKQRPAISVEELKRSYAAWQRATQRLIDLGHTAIQRRLWNTCRRAFKVIIPASPILFTSSTCDACGPAGSCCSRTSVTVN